MIEKDIGGCILGYYVSHEAWYKNVIDQPQINFGLYDPAGGTCGEMEMEWVELGGLTPKLRIFCDAWYALNTFADKLFPILAEHDNDRLTPQRFADILDSIGFTDLTKREREGNGRKTLYTLKETRKRLDEAEHQRDEQAILLHDILEWLQLNPTLPAAQVWMKDINQALATLKEKDA